MSKEENPNGQNKDIDLKNYNGESQGSLKRMNFGLWIAEHRRRIIKTIIIFLIALSAFFFIYSSYNYIVYFISGDPNSQMINNNLSFAARQVTTDLEIAPLQVFDNDGHSDLVVKVSNPNEKFMANFNYCFTMKETGVSCSQTFILPGESKYVFALAQEISGSRSELSFNISNVFWRRIDAHQIPDWGEFANQRLDFAVSGLNFSSAAVSGLSDKVNLSTLDFSIKNQTAYGYYEVPLNIFLYSGSEIVAVNRYILQNFLAGETRMINISWPGSFRMVNRTEVVPDINIMDDNVYLKYQGTSTN
jgi:hypothetical protein